jgi:hypothetical protein
VAAPSENIPVGISGSATTGRSAELSPAAARRVTAVARRSSGQPAATTLGPAGASLVRAKRPIAASAAADEVAQEADQLRQRWTSFQHGRRRAGAAQDN